MDNNYLLWPYVIHIRPLAKKEDVKVLQWISKDDVLIIFTDNKKYIYDTLTGMSRYIRYNDIEDMTNDDWVREFKDRLNIMLARSYMNQSEFAKKLGTTQPMVSRYISGRDMPSTYIINKIINVLDCELDDLFLIPHILKTYRRR